MSKTAEQLVLELAYKHGTTNWAILGDSIAFRREQLFDLAADLLEWGWDSVQGSNDPEALLHLAQALRAAAKEEA